MQLSLEGPPGPGLGSASGDLGEAGGSRGREILEEVSAYSRPKQKAEDPQRLGQPRGRKAKG